MITQLTCSSLMDYISSEPVLIKALRDIRDTSYPTEDLRVDLLDNFFKSYFKQDVPQSWWGEIMEMV